METFRYAVALVLLLSSPWFLFWFLIHPFARFWRQVGLAWTYGLVSVPLIALAALLFSVRDRLLAVEFGTWPGLFLCGLAVLIAAAVLRWLVQRDLSTRTLSGGPELGENPGQLITQGLYAHMRHPRYAQLTLALVGWALVANYLALYVIAVASVPVLYLTAVVEERELRERFGDAYRAYSERVPRFFPRLRPAEGDGNRA